MTVFNEAATNDTYNATIGTTVNVNVLDNDTGVSSINMINGVYMQPGWSTWVEGVGLVTIKEDNTLDIEVAYENPVDFTYGYIADGVSAQATVSATDGSSGGSNSAPDAGNDSYIVPAGTTTVLNVRANDNDIDGDHLTITQINGIDMFPGWDTWVEGVGIVSVNFDGTLSVEPADGVTWGSFEYTISDGKGGTDTATVNLDVNGGPTPNPNSAPNARNDVANVTVGDTVTVNVLGNDNDPDGDALSITQINGQNVNPGQSVYVSGTGDVTLHHNGTLSIEADNSAGYSSFSYTVSDGNGGTDVALVNVNTSPELNQGPNARNDSASGFANGKITVDALGNDRDPNGDQLTITHVGGKAISVGQTVTLNGVGKVTLELNGKLSVDPAARIENASFNYRVSDGKGGTDEAKVTIDIINRDPVANDDYIKVGKEFWAPWDRKDVTVNLAGNDGEPDGDIVSITKIDGQDVWPGKTIKIENIGEVTLNNNGTIFVEPENWMGDKSFTYELTDEHGASDTAVVHLDVHGGFSAAGILGGIVAAVGIAAVATGAIAAVVVGGLVLSSLITPVALDLNEDGEIGVTGDTTSFEKDGDAELGRTVEFDINGDGDLETIEWFDGSGDGILVDTSKIGENGKIDGSALFGAEEGQYDHGYQKLAEHDTDGNGLLKGAELADIALWVDDGDAILEEGELKTIEEENIASISTEMEIVKDEDGKALMQSSATKEDGTVIMSEDVWFVGYEGEVAADPEMQAEVDEMAMAQQEEVIIEDMMM